MLLQQIGQCREKTSKIEEMAIQTIQTDKRKWGWEKMIRA